MICLGEAEQAEHALAWQDQADRAGLNCMKAERIYNLEDSLCAFSPSYSILLLLSEHILVFVSSMQNSRQSIATQVS
jgi:hypothetical protein